MDQENIRKTESDVSNESKSEEWFSRQRCSTMERKCFDKSFIKDKPVIWLMGPTGSGKGTQCDKFRSKYGLIQLSSGELMRNEVLEGTDRSLSLVETMKEGNPVTNSIVIDVVARAIITSAEESKGFILDGFPTDLEQAEEFVREFGLPNLVIHCNCNNTILRERLIGKNNFDDNDEAIKNRFNIWSERTAPVLEKYKAFNVDANKSREEVFCQIEEIVLKHFDLKARGDQNEMSVEELEDIISKSRKTL